MKAICHNKGRTEQDDMLMKQPRSGDKLCSKSKLFLIRSVCVSKDSSEYGIIGPSDTSQVLNEVHGERKVVNPCSLRRRFQRRKGSKQQKLSLYGRGLQPFLVQGPLG